MAATTRTKFPMRKAKTESQAHGELSSPSRIRLYDDLLNFSELSTQTFHFNLTSTLSSTGFTTLEPGFRIVQLVSYSDGICLSLDPQVSGIDHNIQESCSLEGLKSMHKK